MVIGRVMSFGAPVENAVVLIQGQNLFVVSGNAGTYIIKNAVINGGFVTIETQIAGYVDQIKSKPAVSGDSVDISFDLLSVGK
jgi:hypothetical protein